MKKHSATSLSDTKKFRFAMEQALAEIRMARGYLSTSWMGPEHQCLEHAESILTKALLP